MSVRFRNSSAPTSSAQETEVDLAHGLPVQIVGGAGADGATEAKQDTQIDNQGLQITEAQTANEFLSRIAGLSRALGIAADIRVTLLGGTTAVTGTLTAVTTVTTVGTVTVVTGLTNIGGLSANTAVPNWNNQTAIQSNINNITL